MTGSPRDDARARNLARITGLARTQIRESGAEGLSVRAVARDMSMASSAMYRYVRSRDELLTLVIADAYNELADAVDAALEPHDTAAWDVRLRALGRAVRAWALADRASYALLYGTPVAGYRAPADVTTLSGTRVVFRIAAILAARDHAMYGKASAADSESAGAIPAPLAVDLEGIRADYPDVDLEPDLILDTMILWSSLFGTVSFEVFGQFGPDFSDPDQFFEAALDRLCRIP